MSLQVQAESRIKQYEEQLLASDDYKEKFGKEKKVNISPLTMILVLGLQLEEMFGLLLLLSQGGSHVTQLLLQRLQHQKIEVNKHH